MVRAAEGFGDEGDGEEGLRWLGGEVAAWWGGEMSWGGWAMLVREEGGDVGGGAPWGAVREGTGAEGGSFQWKRAEGVHDMGEGCWR